ncbi:Maf family nucleotide pyrophosphatase [Citricoccus nitrophenolicus]|uniref:Nucleoside triphosphate pyrophosphatase n=1 Tax=Citricoccus muralis TaxID=169134 RepID=A0A3D9L9S6_9MICC|nr:nucleoside triphosphate pyrophosphatase [Citricoccus muralis]REE02444.1 septum formation protein [Citricoccus muralis]
MSGQTDAGANALPATEQTEQQAHDGGTPVPRLVLASASPARARILEAAGLPFAVVVSDVDEDAIAAAHPLASPAETAQLLARAKSEDVAGHPKASGALVIGCDSVFELDGVAYGKPWEPEVAIERWRAQSGRTGELHTGHWVVDNRDITSRDDGAPLARPATGALSSAMVRFADVDEEEIAAYVATGEPLQCAGAFTIDGRGAAFVTAVEGDPNAVIGLSVSTLRSLLTEFGVSLASLWEARNA